eukprot:jgi/Bigna1/85138/estExt_fgenesh1_pg.C_20280
MYHSLSSPNGVDDTGLFAVASGRRHRLCRSSLLTASVVTVIALLSLAAAAFSLRGGAPLLGYSPTANRMVVSGVAKVPVRARRGCVNKQFMHATSGSKSNHRGYKIVGMPNDIMMGSISSRRNAVTRDMYAFAAADGEEGPDIDAKLEEAEERMRKSIVSLQNSLMTVSTGRANPAVLDRVNVDYYGAPTPIRSLAGITTPSAQEIIVDPYDKAALADVERAIFAANLGLTPSNDGKIIRISVPMLTEDRRKELAKSVKKFGEEAKVAVRNIRRDTIDFVKKAEKAKSVSEDDSKFYQGEAQNLTDKISKEIEAMISKKEKDLLTI